MLEQDNLQINHSKTEEYDIKREGDEKWKKCKLLGSCLDTTKDIERRKGLAIAAYNKLEKFFKSRTVSQNTKLRMFDAYISSIFMYNSELWTTTVKININIDCFQRKLLKKVLGIYWPKVISNNKLYKKTKQKPWSQVIKRRAMSWLGHLLRLNQLTPARLALNEYCKKGKRPVGKPKESWLSMIRKLLKLNGLTWKNYAMIEKDGKHLLRT